MLHSTRTRTKQLVLRYQGLMSHSVCTMQKLKLARLLRPWQRLCVNDGPPSERRMLPLAAASGTGLATAQTRAHATCATSARSSATGRQTAGRFGAYRLPIDAQQQ